MTFRLCDHDIIRKINRIGKYIESLVESKKYCQGYIYSHDIRKITFDK